MKLTDGAEEILETLWISTEEEKGKVYLNHLKVARDDLPVKELLNLGYIVISRDEIQLAERGRKEARSIVRRHRLAERLMVDVLDLKKEMMNEVACKFEHLLYEEVEESVCTLLGHPKVCPHGKSIPQGRCCKKASLAISPVVSSLIELDAGQRGRIVYLHSKSDKELQKLMALGILPGIPIQIIQKFPSYLLQIGQTQVAMDEEMAKDVYVRLER
ncbi:MAG: metal-dependent transcriptional regulator [bacterium]